jgi:hypothetical protein
MFWKCFYHGLLGPTDARNYLNRMVGAAGLEPATSCV